jgi:ABC-type transporter Mla subunit MlaD
LSRSEFSDDEDDIIQKEVWAQPENQLLITNATQELEKYARAFQNLKGVLDQAAGLLAKDSKEFEELDRVASELKKWLNSSEVYQKNAVEN